MNVEEGNRKIAEWFRGHTPDLAWEPAQRCPQGHHMMIAVESEANDDNDAFLPHPSLLLQRLIEIIRIATEENHALHGEARVHQLPVIGIGESGGQRPQYGAWAYYR